MKKLVLSFLLIARLAAAADIWPDTSTLPAAEYPGEAKKKIEVAKGNWIEASFEISTKGNGAVRLPGVFVRVYDTHDDGLVFRDGFLRCEWRRVGGTLDFVVSGFADHTEGKKGSAPVSGVFRYSAKNQIFEPISCSSEIYFMRIKKPHRVAGGN